MLSQRTEKMLQSFILNLVTIGDVRIKISTPKWISITWAKLKSCNYTFLLLIQYIYVNYKLMKAVVNLVCHILQLYQNHAKNKKKGKCFFNNIILLLTFKLRVHRVQGCSGSILRLPMLCLLVKGCLPSGGKIK